MFCDQEMLQDFEITNNWDLGFYGHEGDVGARCLSHWWGSLGGQKNKQHIFFGEKWQKNRTGIHTCAIKRIIIIIFQFHAKTCIYVNTYLYIVCICTYNNHRNHFCIKICIIYLIHTIHTNKTDHLIRNQKITIVTKVTWGSSWVGDYVPGPLKPTTKKHVKRGVFAPKGNFMLQSWIFNVFAVWFHGI